MVIVIHAVMTYDRSIGTRKAGSGKFCMIYGSAGRTHGAPARQWPSAVSLKKADPRARSTRARSAGVTRGSAENNSQVMTRPDPRDFDNLLTRPDLTREILKSLDPTRPDP